MRRDYLELQLFQFLSVNNGLTIAWCCYPTRGILLNRIDEANEVAAYYGNRAAALIGLGKYNEALEDALKSVSLDPKFTKGYTRVGKCYMQRGEYFSAEQALRKALALEPSNAAIKSEMEQCSKLAAFISAGESALASGDYDRAMVSFTGVLAMTPESISAKRGAAACHLRKKNYTKAAELIRDVLAIDGQDEVAHMIRAETLYYTGAVDSAIKMFINLLELDPDNSKIRSMLKKAREVTRQKEAGDAAFKIGDHEKAVEAYTNALSVDADLDSLNAKIYCNRGGSYFALKQNEEALTDCNQAILLDPKYTRAFMRRAKINAALEQHQDCVYDWNKAKELDPENKEILTALRDAQRALKKAERKDWYKILELSPNATDAEIKKAYRLQALRWHPDKHNETPESYAAAEARFKDITEANTVLSDPKARRRFDNGEDLEEEQGFGGGGFGGGGAFPAEMFAQFFGGGGGGGGFGGFSSGGFPGGSFGYEEDDHYGHSHAGHSHGRAGSRGGQKQQRRSPYA